MRLRCPRCRALYELPPGVLPPPGERVLARCSACGHSFPLLVPDDGTLSRPPGAPPPLGSAPSSASTLPSGRVLLRAEGRVHQARDLAELQRWIAEGRVRGSDLYSRDGLRWFPVAEDPELRVILELLEARRPPPGQAATPAERGWEPGTPPQGDDHARG